MKSSNLLTSTPLSSPVDRAPTAGGILYFTSECWLSFLSILLIPFYSAFSGETRRGGQTFEEFLGEDWEKLKNRYTEWLDNTYSKLLDIQAHLSLTSGLAPGELVRADDSINGPPAGTVSIAPAPSNATSTPRQSPTSDEPPPSSQPPTTPRDDTPPATEVQEMLMTMCEDIRLGSSDEPPEMSSLPPGSQEGWTPSHSPSWTLGPQHLEHVKNAAPFLCAVPGGPEWEELLARFITLEGLSLSLDVSSSLVCDTLSIG